MLAKFVHSCVFSHTPGGYGNDIRRVVGIREPSQDTLVRAISHVLQTVRFMAQKTRTFCDCRESEKVFQILRHKPAQNDRDYSSLPRAILFPR